MSFMAFKKKSCSLLPPCSTYTFAMAFLIEEPFSLSKVLAICNDFSGFNEA
jgi:hypothetical protein